MSGDYSFQFCYQIRLDFFFLSLHAWDNCVLFDDCTILRILGTIFGSIDQFQDFSSAGDFSAEPKNRIQLTDPPLLHNQILPIISI